MLESESKAPWSSHRLQHFAGTEIDENEIDVDSWGKMEGLGLGISIRRLPAMSMSMRLALPFWPNNGDGSGRNGRGKAFSRYFTQIPWENIGPLLAAWQRAGGAASSLKVKKDFQRIYEFGAEPERQTKPSIYICEQVRELEILTLEI